MQVDQVLEYPAHTAQHRVTESQRTGLSVISMAVAFVRGVLMAYACQLAAGESAYHHLLGHAIVSKDHHNALCPAAFMPLPDDTTDDPHVSFMASSFNSKGEHLVGKLGCCIVDKMLSAVEVAFDAEVCGKSFSGMHKGMPSDITKHCKNEVSAARCVE